jgi:uncharacterized protein (TIGR03118 family)
MEQLEDRHLLSGFLQTNLVSDQPNVAPILDPQLINPWGIALSPASGAFWVSDNGSGVSTLYTGDVGGSQLAKAPLTVTVPGGASTGAVFNGTSDFVIRNGGDSGPAVFLFASENGNITGWNPSLPPPAPSTAAQPAVVIPDAVFKGLAIGNNGEANFLYAADFHGGQIDVFDAGFHQVQLQGSFTDPDLPEGYAPFNIRNLGGQLYVTYALQDEAKHDDVPGDGHGFIDVFDMDGNLLNRLVSQGPLNSPWGLALAPDNFGEFSNDLLVGNFGDGRINVFDPNDGTSLGQLTDPSGNLVVIQGLWGLTFGNGVSAGESNILYFAAGPDGEQHGLFGSLQSQDTATGAFQTDIAFALGTRQAESIQHVSIGMQEFSSAKDLVQRAEATPQQSLPMMRHATAPSQEASSLAMPTTHTKMIDQVFIDLAV